MNDNTPRPASYAQQAGRTDRTQTQPQPNALTALERLVGILTGMREEQVSIAMGFGNTPAEKTQRAEFYAAEVLRRAREVDDALEYAEEALKKTKEDVNEILKGIDNTVTKRVEAAIRSPRPTGAVNPHDRHPFVEGDGITCHVCGQLPGESIHVQEWERG